MRLRDGVLELTEQYIQRAFDERDIVLMQKETMFVLVNMALNLSEVYSDILFGVKLPRYHLKNDPEDLFEENYSSTLQNMLTLSQRIFEEHLDFAETIIQCESWFYAMTDAGILHVEFKPEHFITIDAVADELNVSVTMVHQYLERGLEPILDHGKYKIAKSTLTTWKNPVLAEKMEWIHQIKLGRERDGEKG